MSEENTSSNKDSISNVIVIALGVCLFCAVVVAGSAVALKERRVENKALDKSKNVLIASNARQFNTGCLAGLRIAYDLLLYPGENTSVQEIADAFPDVDA